MASVLKNKRPKVSVLLYFSCFLMTFKPVSMESASPVFACDVDKDLKVASFRFCNKSLGIDERVADLVKKLTLEEKISFLVSGAGNVNRLGIPKYEWWSEALHGVSNLGPGTRFSDVVPGATSFPQVILTAASFDTSLFENIGKVVSTEARAMYNEGLAGLTFWSPNVNIFRDPRWGRGQETPGEDPLLSGKYASAYVRGLQQTDHDDPNRLKVAACCKHYTAYDLDKPKDDKSKETDRFHFNALVTKQDMEDTFEPPFKSCVIDGKVASVMCSYNQVNGKPTCADPDLLQGVIRGKWNLTGYIVSDCDSLEVFFSSQHYTKTAEEAAADAILAGLDLDCGSFLSKHTKVAVEANLVDELSINRAISNNFATLMRLGFFDGDPRNQNYGNLGPKNVCTPDHKKLARLAARQGIVLLKNTVGSLPLSPATIKTLVVIGPNADAKETMIGNYKGIPCNYTTPLQGLKAVVERTTHVAGCFNVACKFANVVYAKEKAASADAIVLVMGVDQSIEAEGLDRVDILLPGQQSLLVSEVANVSKGPVILVIMSGGGMDISFAKHNDKITSILWVGYPGEAGGAAIADVIFGDHNPSGRLPMTWYPQSYVQRVPMTNMNMRPDASNFYTGRTYRFYTGETVYSFGEGLSYTTFTHELMKAPNVVLVTFKEGQVCQSSSFDIQLRVKNTGGRSGGHTVLLFFSPPISVHKAPHKQLIAFEKVFLGEGAEALVKFIVNACTDLSVVDEHGKRKVPLGEYALHIGALKRSFHINIRSNLAELHA